MAIIDNPLYFSITFGVTLITRSDNLLHFVIISDDIMKRKYQFSR